MQTFDRQGRPHASEHQLDRVLFSCPSRSWQKRSLRHGAAYALWTATPWHEQLAVTRADPLAMHATSASTCCLPNMYTCHLQVPYFNAPIFLQNKTQIGRIEEIFGGITNTVSVTCMSSTVTINALLHVHWHQAHLS